MGGSVTPIALFVFKRPDHALRTLQSLAANPEFRDLPLFVFCDDARRDDEREAVEATRRIIREFDHPQKTVVERIGNKGLAGSIIEGVGDLCAKFGRVIVLEDDLLLSEAFLRYMLAALDRYENAPQVMQVSGHAFPVSSFQQSDPVLFLPFISSWGWATWARAWEAFDPKAADWQKLISDWSLSRRFDIDGAYPYSAMLASQMQGRIDSWAIRWNWSVFRRNGLVIYPPVSLVTNIGFDGSGTHRSTNSNFEVQAVSAARDLVFTDPPAAPDRDDRRYRLVRRSIETMQGSPLKQFAKRLHWLYTRVRLYLFLKHER
jgi:Glycosyl transferase family 2